MHGGPVIFAVLALFCAGCAATGTARVDMGHELLAARSEVATSPPEISYQEIAFEEPCRFAFDEKASVLEVGNERRFAKGFALPVGRGSYSVSITSYKAGTLHDPAIMYPEVQLLDKEYSPIRTLPHTDFVFRPSLSGDGLKTVFFINGVSQRECFLLITNRPMAEADLTVSQSNITSAMPVGVPFPGGYVMWIVPTGSNTPPVKMKASPIGEIVVILEEYRPKKIGQ